ncbi:unnamed protein product [Ectocarpus sp. 8 AP-2014]
MQENAPASGGSTTTGAVAPPLPPVSTPTRPASFPSCTTSPGSPELEVSVLRRELLMEKHKNSHLEGELVKLRKSAVEISQQVEAEEECLINRVSSPTDTETGSRMMKRLMELKKEKEDLALEVEREEELLTNTLQKKLNQLRQEKVDLENQLEREQEYVVNKLRKQLAQVTADKERMAMEVEREEEFLTNKLVKKLDQLKEEKAAVEEQLAQERGEVKAVTAEKGELETLVEQGAKALLSKLQESLERAHDRRDPEEGGEGGGRELEAMAAQAKELASAATTSRERRKQQL